VLNKYEEHTHARAAQCNVNIIAAIEYDIRLQSIMTLAEVHYATFFIDYK